MKAIVEYDRYLVKEMATEGLAQKTKSLDNSVRLDMLFNSFKKSLGPSGIILLGGGVLVTHLSLLSDFFHFQAVYGKNIAKQ